MTRTAKPLTLKTGEAAAPAPPVPQERRTITPMEMLNQALERGDSIDLLEKLMTMQERWQAAQARAAFDEAIAAAKAKIKPIKKTVKVKYAAKEAGKPATGYQHETLADIAQQVDPILAEYGLSYRFRPAQANGVISVTTIVSHRDGYYEESTLSSQPDNSGGKNAIQAIGSAITYLQRYGIKCALGLAAAPDDDAQGSGGPETISEAQVKELETLAGAVGADIAKFCAYLQINRLADIRSADFDRAKQSMLAKRKKADPAKVETPNAGH